MLLTLCRALEEQRQLSRRATAPADVSDALAAAAAQRQQQRINFHVGVLHFTPSSEPFPLLADEAEVRAGGFGPACSLMPCRAVHVILIAYSLACICRLIIHQRLTSTVMRQRCRIGFPSCKTRFPKLLRRLLQVKAAQLRHRGARLHLDVLWTCTSLVSGALHCSAALVHL